MRSLFAVIFCAFFLFAMPARAATLIVDGTGQLRGAEGVIVSGKVYNVQFLEGSCVELFSGCDALSDFDFANRADSLAAAEALLAQVFLDGLQGEFDTDPGSIFGCASAASSCNTLIPDELFGAIQLRGAASFNAAIEANDATSSAFFATSDPSSAFASVNYARFSLVSTAVPEPATWLMLIVGLFGIGGAMRKRQTGSIRSALFA